MGFQKTVKNLNSEKGKALKEKRAARRLPSINAKNVSD